MPEKRKLIEPGEWPIILFIAAVALGVYLWWA
jgi:hypothetical protein